MPEPAAADADAVEVGVTYWPAAVGPYLWHEFDAVAVRRDLEALVGQRFRTVRVLLSWDAFMPTDRAPHPRRMRDLETLLEIARELGAAVVVTLFAQSLGDSVMLPAYAVDRVAPRRGVRCVTEGRAVDGGPRDLYTDPLMLEVEVRWLDALLAAFAAHPAVAAWDLGYDPATTMRPRRIAHMVEWAALLAERIHAQGERCRLTLGQDDLTTGRAVRPGALAEHVDALGLLLRPQRLALPGEGLDAGRAAFMVALGQALTGTGTPLVVDVGLASAETELTGEWTGDGDPTGNLAGDPSAVARAADELLQRLAGAGAAGIHAAAAWDWGPRTAVAPPADTQPWCGRLGLAGAGGAPKPLAQAWAGLLETERSRTPVVAFPDGLDASEYYANLPDSLLDLHAAWQGRARVPPAILR